MEAAAPGSGEGLAVELVDLLESLQAVGDEAGADDVEAGAAGTAEIADRVNGGRPDPGGGPEDGLEGELGEAIGQVESPGEELGGALALGAVGVSGVVHGLGNGVEGQQEALAGGRVGAAVDLPVLLQGDGEGLDVGRRRLEGADGAQLGLVAGGQDEASGLIDDGAAEEAAYCG